MSKGKRAITEFIGEYEEKRSGKRKATKVYCLEKDSRRPKSVQNELICRISGLNIVLYHSLLLSKYVMITL